MEFSIAFYKKPDGTQPAMNFINSLDPKMKAKVLRTIQLSKQFGSDLNGFVKKTQKTPESEIALAKKYKDNYLKDEEV